MNKENNRKTGLGIAICFELIQYWKKNLEKSTWLLKIYSSSEWISKFGESDAEECARNIEWIKGLIANYQDEFMELADCHLVEV